ncbi:hypothetical protein RAZWK3B_15458 [Roseobacter sp. AzwK-3b]|uniref:hypothetical protein n=1 Tax=Roseobacter sp. AzwK-3b TaxID=351016 RepID=UPI000156A4DA|nr:hypothetical protein [Roseobacter sp. AzwK-3b]EDM70807.1 hypothetical protein RAZWK3B_15458 [Roseobacter sp. AzwK-3b]
MFFRKRRRWNGEVIALLPMFDLTPDILGGPLAILDSLDLVYRKGFSHQEGALFLAYNAYATFIKTEDPRSVNLAHRINLAEEEWIKIGRATPALIHGWRDYIKGIKASAERHK